MKRPVFIHMFLFKSFGLKHWAITVTIWLKKRRDKREGETEKNGEGTDEDREEERKKGQKGWEEEERMSWECVKQGEGKERERATR